MHPFEPEMIVHDLENIRLRIQALPAHPRCMAAGAAIEQAEAAIKRATVAIQDARVDLHQSAAGKAQKN